MAATESCLLAQGVTTKMLGDSLDPNDDDNVGNRAPVTPPDAKDHGFLLEAPRAFSYCGECKHRPVECVFLKNDKRVDRCYICFYAFERDDLINSSAGSSS